jgi:hypothetical protein
VGSVLGKLTEIKALKQVPPNRTDRAHHSSLLPETKVVNRPPPYRLSRLRLTGAPMAS